MADYKEKKGLGEVLTRWLIGIILGLLVTFLTLFLAIAIVAIVSMSFSDQDLVGIQTYCHKHQLGVSLQRDSRGNITNAECDPDVEWNP